MKTLKIEVDPPAIGIQWEIIEITDTSIKIKLVFSNPILLN